MCGITGFIDFTSSSSGEVLERMTDQLHHRGPDDMGLFFTEVNNKKIGLGHKRLSIIDLSEAGHQPMTFKHLHIVFNGEIYNYKEIKSELKSKGHSFVSKSDTEVILKAFFEWGKECVHKFRGMWAFSIWDSENEKLFLCRDRVGVKPLYWYYKDGVFMYGSELKSLYVHPSFKKNMDYSALSLFLQYGYITAPYSIFQDTYKLEPGYWLEFNTRSKKLDETCYWNSKQFYLEGLEKRKEWLEKSEDEVADELEAILLEGFQLRMVSDVPVGLFLSGGIDSSLVTALLQNNNKQNLQTFTIGFKEEAYNEASWAKKVADHLGTNHTEFYCTYKEAADIIPQLPHLYDEPFGDSSAVPTHLVSKLARQHVKVALSADGGDEQFCGYTRFWDYNNLNKRITAIPLLKSFLQAGLFLTPDFVLSTVGNSMANFSSSTNKNLREKVLKFKRLVGEDEYLKQYDTAIKNFMPYELLGLGLSDIAPSQFQKINGAVSSIDYMSQSMYYDIETYLPDDILTKVDRASMGVSLESREPFLDNKILEYSCRLPVEFKYKQGKSKYILKKILNRYLPNELIERPKQGFAIPIHSWLRKDLTELYHNYLNPDRLKQEGILDSKFVHNMCDAYFTKQNIHPFKLWYLLMFQMWKEKYMN